MDLTDLLAPPPPRGRQPLEGAYVRDLVEADVSALWDLQPGDLDIPGQSILKIRNVHHSLAKLLAEGRKLQEISLITGYNPAYICTIQNDPAMANLITYYKSQVDETYVNVHERLATISMVAAEELMERITEKPETFTNREAMELVALAADRTGHGPQSRNTQVNVNIDLATRLENARLRVESLDLAPAPEPRSAPPMLEHNPGPAREE